MDERIAGKIERFFGTYPLKNYKRGQILIYAGEDPPGIIYLVKGEVRQYDIISNGDEVEVNAYKPPAFFPMSWAITKIPNEYFFEAKTNISVRVAPATKTVAFIHDNPDVALNLLARLYSGINGMQRRMVLLMGGSAQSRTVFELIVACRRFGKPHPDGKQVDLTEKELGARAGLTRETVSRQLKKLADQKLIIRSYKHILVPDVTKLEEYIKTSL